MSKSYWHKVWQGRLSRRRALATATAGTAAAALLAACGGSGANGGDEDISSLVVGITDETKNVKRGGRYTLNTSTLGPNLDPTVTGAQQTYLSYSRLLHIKEGYMKNTSGEMEGDIAESWEVSPDKLTVTMRITDQAHFTPLPPLNGRAVDVGDVMFSWERFRTIGSKRQELVNEVNPDAPILSVTQPDNRTIVIKIKEPDVTMFGRLGDYQAGSWVIVPKEAADPRVLDLRTQQAGSGPWNLVDYQPSVGATYKRNPGFNQDKRNIPYMDELYYVLLTEPAALLANFKSGQILGVNVSANDLLQTKADVPELEVRERALAAASPRVFWGHAGNSPFKDDRVRLAFSMSVDRDLFLDVFYNVENFRRAGLPMQTYRDTALAANSFEGWWLDPKGKDFGPNAKYYERNLEEAKKLLSAAGYPNGVSYKAYIPTFGGDFDRRAEVLLGMPEEIGLRAERSIMDWATEYNTTFRYNRGEFEGCCLALDPPIPDPTASLFSHFHSRGANYYNGDATLDDMIIKMLREFDDKKRQTMAHDLQRYEAAKQYKPRWGCVSAYGLDWPAVRNRGVWQGDYLREFTTIFLDQERPPFKRA